MYRIYLFNDFDNIDENFIQKSMSLLPEERQDKASHYKYAIDRKMCVVSYLLLLYALRENYGIISPQIAYTRYKKPYLLNYPDIHFNISHCPTGCVCVISDKEVGIDVQDIRPFSMEIANLV